MRKLVILLLLSPLVAQAATTSPNMSLQIPQVGDTDYPTSISNSFTLMDAHDHSSGKGVLISAGGLASNAVTTAKILDGNVTLAKLAADAANLLMPIGSVVAYAGTSAPTGWLICDGSAVSRTVTYSALFAAIGTAHGIGNGSTTFNIPDYRGRFLRGRDGGAGRDPDAGSRGAAAAGGAAGDNVGSVQSGAFASHTHINTLADAGHNHIQKDRIGNIGPGNVAAAVGGGVIDNATTTTATENSTSNISITNVAAGGNETRPVNANVQYIIKY